MPSTEGQLVWTLALSWLYGRLGYGWLWDRRVVQRPIIHRRTFLALTLGHAHEHLTRTGASVPVVGGVGDVVETAVALSIPFGTDLGSGSPNTLPVGRGMPSPLPSSTSSCQMLSIVMATGSSSRSVTPTISTGTNSWLTGHNSLTLGAAAEQSGG